MSPRPPPAGETLPAPNDDALPWASGPEPAPAVPASPPPRYQVLRELARGGLGRILEAHDRDLDRPVALKELLRESPGDRARLEREIRLTARLQHPSIVPLYEAVRAADGSLRYAMKLVSGETLEAAIRACPGLNARLALLRHVEAVADALAYAHARGVLHRDVKPQNILIGAFGETVLIDWGIALELEEGEPPAGAAEEAGRGLDARLTQQGSVVGTPAYMAPEQARGERADRRADVHALGATLYHLLSGRPPWTQDTRETLQALRDGQRPPPLDQVVAGVPADLRSIVERAMAPDPADRYPSALEFSRDLRAFRDGQLVAARRYSAWELAGRWLARHKALVGTIVLAALCLLALAVASSRRIVQERDLARAAQAVAEARARALVLAHARQALATDPTEAAAWLATWASTPDDTADRHLLAGELPARGVARLVTRQSGDGCDSLQWSKDQAYLLPVGVGTGPIRAADGRAQPPVDLKRVDAIIPWHGGEALWLAPMGEIVRRGPSGPQRRVASVEGRVLARLVWDRARVLVGTREGGLWEVDVEGGSARRIFQRSEPVTVLARLGDRWLTVEDGLAVVAGDLQDRRERLFTHDAPIGPLEASQAGVFFGDDLGRVFRWKAGERVRLPSDGTSAIKGLALSPDQAWLAAWDGAGRLQVLGADGMAGAAAPRSPPWSPSRVIGLSWAPDRELLAVHLADGSLRLWWPRDGQSLTRRSADATHATPVFSPDGREVAGCAVNGALRVWPAPEHGELLFSGHEGRIFHVQALPGGRFATDSDDGTVRVWGPGAEDRRVLAGHQARVYGLSASPAGDRLLSASEDGRAVIWDLATGQGTALEGHGGRVHKAGWLPDGAGVFTAAQDGLLRTWNLDGTLRASVQAHQGPAWWATLDEAGEWLWSAGGDRRLQRWNLRTGQAEELAAGLGERGSGTLRPYRLEGDRVLICDGAGGLSIFGPEGRRDIPLPEPPGCASMAVAPLGDRVAFSSGETLWRLDPGEGQPVRVGRQEGDIHSIAFSPDGRLLATAGVDGAARLWRLADGAASVAWRAEGPVLGLAFSADGHQLAAAGVDALLWVGPVDEAALAPVTAAELDGWLRALTSLRRHQGADGALLP